MMTEPETLFQMIPSCSCSFIYQLKLKLFKTCFCRGIQMAGPIYTIFLLINSIHNSLQFAPPFSLLTCFIYSYKNNDLWTFVAYHLKSILYISLKSFYYTVLL